VTLSFDLPPTLTHAVRRYTLVPAAAELVDAYLTIACGAIGPRGGTSRLKVDGYFVQEVTPEPHLAHVGREFLLLKDRPGNNISPFEFDRDDESAEPYAVFVPLSRRAVGWCSCRAYRCGMYCKHLDALNHAVKVAGWRMPRARPQMALAE